MRIQTNAAGRGSSDIKLQTDSIDALVVKGTGNIEIAKDLDVDGHTNLDNVSIAGITTFSDSIYAGRIYLGGSNGKYMQAGSNFELEYVWWSRYYFLSTLVVGQVEI